ncbi:hypothetical protein KJ632_00515 [Patescibacteria group bacterium]|nr:hypothetical protein [Patescibacteria group bacterium]
MTTKLVGLKEFRLNLSSLTKEVESGKVRLIVLKKNKPVLEVNPIDSEDEVYTLEDLERDIQEAREQVKRGEVRSLDEVKKDYGL